MLTIAPYVAPTELYTTMEYDEKMKDIAKSPIVSPNSPTTSYIPPTPINSPSSSRSACSSPSPILTNLRSKNLEEKKTQIYLALKDKFMCFLKNDDQFCFEFDLVDKLKDGVVQIFKLSTLSKNKTNNKELSIDDNIFYKLLEVVELINDIASDINEMMKSKKELLQENNVSSRIDFYRIHLRDSLVITDMITNEIDQVIDKLSINDYPYKINTNNQFDKNRLIETTTEKLKKDVQFMLDELNAQMSEIRNEYRCIASSLLDIFQNSTLTNCAKYAAMTRIVCDLDLSTKSKSVCLQTSMMPGIEI